MDNSHMCLSFFFRILCDVQNFLGIPWIVHTGLLLFSGIFSGLSLHDVQNLFMDISQSRDAHNALHTSSSTYRNLPKLLYVMDQKSLHELIPLENVVMHLNKFNGMHFQVLVRQPLPESIPHHVHPTCFA